LLALRDGKNVQCLQEGLRLLIVSIQFDYFCPTVLLDCDNAVIDQYCEVSPDLAVRAVRSSDKLHDVDVSNRR
jgi:hypothetical protein